MKAKTNFKETNNEDNFTLAMEHRPTRENATRQTLIQNNMMTKIKITYHGIQIEIETGVIGQSDLKNLLREMTQHIYNLKRQYD